MRPRARYAHGRRPAARTAGACECARAGLEGRRAGHQSSTVGVVERGSAVGLARRHRRLLVVGSPCVSRLSRRAGAQEGPTTGDGWRPWRATWFPAPRLLVGPVTGGRRHEWPALVARAHAPTPSCCAGGRRPLRRCRAAGELVNVSRAKSRRQGASEKKKKPAGRDCAARACRRPRCSAGPAAGAPPPSHGRRPLLLPAPSWTLAARARVLRSRGRAREVQGCGAAGRCGPAAPCSAARAAAADGRRRRATSRALSRVAGLAARDRCAAAPRSALGCPRRCCCRKAIGRARAAAAAKQDPLGGARFARLSRQPAPAATSTGRSSPTRLLSSLLLRSRVPGGRLQHEAPVTTGVPSLLEPGRNLPPSAGPSATPPRRPHMPSAAALRVTFAPGCCSSFLPSARLSSPRRQPCAQGPQTQLLASGLDHTTLSIPHLVRSGKSSSVGRG